MVKSILKIEGIGVMRENTYDEVINMEIRKYCRDCGKMRTFRWNPVYRVWNCDSCYSQLRGRDGRIVSYKQGIKKGWYGERKRHSIASRKGKRKR